MPFVKGAPGRPVGTKNDPKLGSLKVLLHDAFVRNRSAAMAKIDGMFMSADLTDFKWLCNVKASLEPREQAPPPPAIDQSVHHHYNIDLSKLSEEQKHEIIVGRKRVSDFVSNT